MLLAGTRRPLASLAISAPIIIAACMSPASGGQGGVPRWPDTLPAASAFGAPRGLSPRRAIVHVHSVYSHDACDEKPQDEAGRLNERCLERFRRGLCAARADAAFLSEHDRYLVRADSLEEALLLRPGDRPLSIGGRVVANRLPCGTLLFAGAENALSPVGLDSLPKGSHEERRLFYESQGPGAAERFRRHGATVLLTHPEMISPERTAALDIDGIEIYNPHANFAPKHRRAQEMSRLGALFELAPFVLRLTRAHPDLALLAIFHANRKAIDRWDALLARKMVFGFGASDAHENALPWTLADGDRGDSYFRMLAWVTNVLLTEPATTPGAKATATEEALRSGRFYAVIEAWGTPTGFDFHLVPPAGAGTRETVEMGATVAFRPGQRLRVSPPSVFGLSPGQPTPAVRARVYRIDAAGRRIVADSRGSIDVPVPAPGAYRVEIGIVPRHLAPYLGDDAERYLREVAWIYSNPIRVIAAPGAGLASERSSRRDST